MDTRQPLTQLHRSILLGAARSDGQVRMGNTLDRNLFNVVAGSHHFPDEDARESVYDLQGFGLLYWVDLETLRITPAGQHVADELELLSKDGDDC